MSRLAWFLVCLSLLSGPLDAAAIGQDGTGAAQIDAPMLPDWIWRHDTCAETGLSPRAGQACRMERRFQANQPVQSATLRLAADFCRATVTINGYTVASVEPFSPAIDVDATAAFRAGENVIIVAAEPVAGPTAIALSLSLTGVDGSRITVVSDDGWTAWVVSERDSASTEPSRRATVSMGQVEPALWGIGRRPATITPLENYEQWRQAAGTPPDGDPAAFWTAPGFEIALLRSAASDEGSWVSAAFDADGRLTIAREDQGLMRLTFDAARRSVVRVETINDDLQECRGLLYAYDALYASANNSKGLYRLRDADGDGRFEEVKLLRALPGGVGHGRNDLALGPDGRIYLICGDAVDIPQQDITDRTSPYREARRGQVTREGFLLRTDRDGNHWELVCAGLRNPFGIDFHPQGDLFTYDADAEFDMGTPWYRPTRVVQLVSGADYGWRGVTGKWPPYYPDHPDNALPTLDIGKGSPTAVAFGTKTHFPPEYRKALFILDWTYGRILAVHLAPRGAGYRAQAETFLQGRPLNVTDLAVGPDGALYVVTGGRKTQSALYRIAYIGDDVQERPTSPHERACEQHAAAARALRIELEAHHGGDSPTAIDTAWPHLDSADPVVRYAARIAVEHQPLDAWKDRALTERRPTASLTALTAAARSANQTLVPAVIERLLDYSAQELDVTQTLMLLHAYSLCRELAPEAVAARREQTVEQLDAVFSDSAVRPLQASPAGTSAVVQRELARLLIQLGSPSAVEKTTRLLLESPHQEDRLHGLLLLRGARAGWNLESGRAYFNALNNGHRFIAGEGMPQFLARLREEAVATLSDTQRQELADLLTRPADDSPEEPLPPARPLVKQWTMDDLAPLLLDASRRGNAKRGAGVFREALCDRCHRVGARGPAVGPDLTHVAGRFSRRDVLESILEPSKVVAENYRNLQVRTTDGRVLVGRVLEEGDYRSEKLRLATDPLQPSQVVELNKRDIQESRESETSPMPRGLLDTFDAAAILDLLAFLECRREAQ